MSEEAFFSSKSNDRDGGVNVGPARWVRKWTIHVRCDFRVRAVG